MYCNCYEEREEIVGWNGAFDPIVRTVGRCNGTRERDACSCEGNQCNCDFYEHIREGVKNNRLEDMKQYHFEREQFEKAWEDVFTKEELVMVLSEGNLVTTNFLYTRIDDEYYLIHLDSGTLINWYKHLGRTNTCSNENFTLDDLYTMLQLYAIEYRDEVLSKRKVQQVSKTNGVDVASCYPGDVLKLKLNSVYGLSKINIPDTLTPTLNYTYVFTDIDGISYKIRAKSKKDAVGIFNKKYGIPFWFIRKYFTIKKEK